MEKAYYNKLLAKGSLGMDDAEARWDAKAKDFSQAQKTDVSGFTQGVLAFLHDRNLLQGAKVLDIGGGSGRYALPFAARADHVTLTDISGQMLNLAQEEAQNQGLSNLTFVKDNWMETSLEDKGWNQAFDFVFASMCPAVKSPQGFRKMTQACRGTCLMTQFITDTDSLATHLKDRLGLKQAYDPHNDRNTVQAAFNLLWLEGFEPEITYLRQGKTTSLGLQEAYQVYARRFEEPAKAQGHRLQDLIAEFAQDHTLTIDSRASLAMVVWNVCV